MDRDTLRALQAPLKSRYKDEPGEAMITLKAKGTLGENVSCSVDTGRAIAQAGLHPATGGDGTLLCSGDMLLEALVACAGVTLGAVSTSIGVNVESGTVYAEGDLDFRGTLGVDREAPVGFARHPPALRARHRRRRRAARDAAQADRALLRRAADARARPAARRQARARRRPPLRHQRARHDGGPSSAKRAVS